MLIIIPAKWNKLHSHSVQEKQQTEKFISTLSLELELPTSSLGISENEEKKNGGMFIYNNYRKLTSSELVPVYDRLLTETWKILKMAVVFNGKHPLRLFENK